MTAPRVTLVHAGHRWWVTPMHSHCPACVDVARAIAAQCVRYGKRQGNNLTPGTHSAGVVLDDDRVVD